ncbi:hypothetical protein, partial [Rhizobium sp. BK060]|uniref:hypothetical protein n=1 Tax=Rhizobium sp. BK060 TaxID=2587096 RepID=UPI001AEEC519
LYAEEGKAEVLKESAIAIPSTPKAVGCSSRSLIFYVHASPSARVVAKNKDRRDDFGKAPTGVFIYSFQAPVFTAFERWCGRASRLLD